MMSNTVNSDRGRFFKCAECDKSYRLQCQLKVHFDCAHQEIVRLKCTECSKVYFHIDGLKAHMKISHNKRKPPYQCYFCSKAATCKSALVTHMRKHTKEKSLNKCQRCLRTFRTFYQFKEHIELKSCTKGDPGNPWHTRCYFCNKEFPHNLFSFCTIFAVSTWAKEISSVSSV
jgi:hypothetical protein